MRAQLASGLVAPDAEAEALLVRGAERGAAHNPAPPGAPGFCLPVTLVIGLPGGSRVWGLGFQLKPG